MRDLLPALQEAIETERPIVLCSVVETRGSTPQKAGAAMLVLADGKQIGTLGGGCVEAEVKRRSLLAISETTARAELLKFSLDDDYGWDDGLICGGRMMILADPVREPQSRTYFRELTRYLRSGQGCTELVALDNNPFGIAPGTRLLLDAAGSLIAASGMGKVADAILELPRPLAQRPGSSVQKGMAILPHLPRITLLIVGGGHVGREVAELAAKVDFDIWILDDRESYIGPDRFPAAQRRLVGDIGRTLQDLVRTEVHPGVYSLVITRGHNHDEEALYHLAASSAGYVGMIGSKRKIRLIFDDLLAKGITAEQLARVFAPLGLSIGSQTVPEIAVSIVAELIAFRNTGNSLRQQRNPLTEVATP